MNFSQVFSKLHTFLIFSLIFWLIPGFWVMIVGYKETFLQVNMLHNAFADIFMPHLTHFADGIIITVIAIFLYWRKQPEILLLWILALLISLPIINVLKHNIFTDWHRPPTVFGKDLIHYITVQNEHRYSFPSGHSMCAAMMMTFVAWLGEKKWMQGLAVLGAVFLGYTRIYIGVHFLGDVVVGNFLGVLIAFFCLSFASKLTQHKIAHPDFWKKASYFLIFAAFFASGIDIWRFLHGIYKIF